MTSETTLIAYGNSSALGVKKMKLLTNNPRKIVGVEGYGLEVVERVALELPSTTQNLRYLETKRDRLGHLLTHLPESGKGQDLV
jgi:3,4-dihydroxy 2-butanone 4-phosphate synthase/GTP cyclohydrolase II